jgi:hypothetical protein
MLELLPAFLVGNKSSCASQLELFKPSLCMTKSASVFFGSLGVREHGNPWFGISGVREERQLCNEVRYEILMTTQLSRFW